MSLAAKLKIQIKKRQQTIGLHGTVDVQLERYQLVKFLQFINASFVCFCTVKSNNKFIL